MKTVDADNTILHVINYGEAMRQYGQDSPEEMAAWDIVRAAIRELCGERDRLRAAVLVGHLVDDYEEGGIFCRFCQMKSDDAYVCSKDFPHTPDCIVRTL